MSRGHSKSSPEARHRHKLAKKSTPLMRLQFDKRKEAEAANRRKLLDKLDPETRAMTIREFAKLGLTQ